MDLSIIIVNFNTKNLLENCLSSVYQSLKDSKLSFEVTVVDNGSTDSSPEMIRHKFCKVKMIKNKENVGYGRANNQALRQSRGEYLLLLNSDTEVIGEGIERLLTFMKENKKADVVGGKLFNQDKTPQASCGPFYSLPICFLMLFLKGDRLQITRWSPLRVREVDWVSGACLMAKRKVFEQASFDEKIFMYMDEIEFLYRANRHGLRVFFYPQAEFVHVGAASSRERKTPVLNIYRGLLYFYQKHHFGWRLFFLKTMLKGKALGAYFWGVLTGNHYLKETYAKAFALVR